MGVLEFLLRAERGAAVPAAAHSPPKANGFGAVVAPGRGYHMGMPLMVATAQRLADAGFFTLRFDWAYQRAGGDPSPDLDAELEDLRAAIAHLKQETDGLFLAGKSLGSFIVARHLCETRDDGVRGAALLTFPLHAPGDPFDMRVGDIHLELGCPVVVVGGAADTLCRPGALFDYVGRFEPVPSVVLLPGDHSLKSDDPQITEASIDLASRTVATWARQSVLGGA